MIPIIYRRRRVRLWQYSSGFWIIKAQISNSDIYFAQSVTRK